ncbi:MAG: AAA family ATPase [Nitrospinae bacterium]|nr:AAA family ATPase [Nitrospinota bacterium]
MAEILAVVNQKGGVGKTLLATNISLMLHLKGQRTLLIDGDSQPSASRWMSRREAAGLAAIPLITLSPEESLIKVIEKNQGKYDWIVVDVGGRLQARAIHACSIATLVVAPVIPASEDMDSTQEFIELALRPITRIKSVNAVLAPNCVRPNTILHREALGHLSNLGPAVAESPLGMRAVYQESASTGMGVVELDERGAGGQEIAALFKELTGIKWGKAKRQTAQSA